MREYINSLRVNIARRIMPKNVFDAEFEKALEETEFGVMKNLFLLKCGKSALETNAYTLTLEDEGDFKAKNLEGKRYKANIKFEIL